MPDATLATPKPLRITVLDEGTRRKPQKIKSRPGRIRTSDQGIMSHRVECVNTEENEHSGPSAAPRAAVVMENSLLDPDLAAIIECWPDLPDTVKAGILAMVRGYSSSGS